MRSYSYCRMAVDGRVTAELEIISEHNTFNIFEHDANVFSGGYTGALEYVNEWKSKWEEIKELLNASGHFATWEQTIR